jgi:hypothetical protein
MRAAARSAASSNAGNRITFADVFTFPYIPQSEINTTSPTCPDCDTYPGRAAADVRLPQSPYRGATARRPPSCRAPCAGIATTSAQPRSRNSWRPPSSSARTACSTGSAWHCQPTGGPRKPPACWQRPDTTRHSKRPPRLPRRRAAAVRRHHGREERSGPQPEGRDRDHRRRRARRLVLPPAQVNGEYMTGTSPVHDRYMTGSTGSSLTEDTGNPCGMTPPLARRPDPGKAPLATAPRRPSIPAAATRARSRPPWQPRRDGAGRSGRLPRPQARTRPARRPARAGRPRTAGPGCPAYISQASKSGCPCNGTKRARTGKASGSHEPLVPPGRCTPYVRNHCYASTRGDTR